MDKKKKRHQQQTKPASRSTTKSKAIDESFEEIFTEDFYGKDYAFLVEQPVCESDDFVFKFEKSWEIEIDKFSEFFSLDLKKLTKEIEELRFDQLVGIEEKFFTSDQLTFIENNAAKSKQSKTLSTSNEKVKKESTEEYEDLDFLLSLKEPVAVPSTLLKQTSSYGSKGKSGKEEKLDLEKWLDSVLDD